MPTQTAFGAPESALRSGGGGLVWSKNPFASDGRAALLILRLTRGLASYTEGFAQRVQAYARENAPWQDRTGDARSGLTAKGQQRLHQYSITLFHTVEYGLWLEVRWSGKYAIIRPTLEVMGPQFMAELELRELVIAGGG
jgi:hypothetical protein